MNDFSDEELIIGVIVALIFIGYLAALIFFLIAQQNTLKSIKPHNRKMQPGEVWLQLIPVFNLIWQFIVVGRISDSIRNEINDRNLNSFLGIADPVFANDHTRRPTYDIGLTYCILSLCGCIPLLGGIASLAGIVCWIVYWTQIVSYKNKFLRSPLSDQAFSPPSGP